MKQDKVMNDFYEFCLTTCSEKRLRKIKIVLKKIKKIINKNLSELNINDVVKILAYINQSDYKPYTKNDYKKIFKRFLKWHYKDLEMFEGDKVKDGFKLTSKLKCVNREKLNKNTLVKPQDLEKFLRTAKTLKWKALITLMYESAFRPCEIKNLKWKHIKFDDSMNICRVWTLSPKTKDSREVPVRDCIIHLKRWKEEYSFMNRNENDYVFPSQHDRNKPLSDGTITEMFKRLSKEAGLKDDRRIFPYKLRHSRIYEIQKRFNEKIASKFAGHSIQTSEIYNHLDSDDVEKAVLQMYATKEITPEQKDRIKELEDKLNKINTNYNIIMDNFPKLIENIDKKDRLLNKTKKILSNIK